MGRLDKLKSFFKRDSSPCTYELQEYGGGGEKGWRTIKTADLKISKKDVLDAFTPGHYYRLLERSLETGKFTKVIWKHYEPRLGIQDKEAEPKVVREEAPPPSPAEVMSEYAEGFREYMKPMIVFGEIMKDMRESFFGATGGNPSGGEIPPLEFSGKAPWMMHPYVVKTLGDTVNQVIDHAADRFLKPLQKAGYLPAEEEKPPEEKEELPDLKLPSPKEFKKQVKTKRKKVEDKGGEKVE